MIRILRNQVGRKLSASRSVGLRSRVGSGRGPAPLNTAMPQNVSTRVNDHFLYRCNEDGGVSCEEKEELGIVQAKNFPGGVRIHVSWLTAGFIIGESDWSMAVQHPAPGKTASHASPLLSE